MIISWKFLNGWLSLAALRENFSTGTVPPHFLIKNYAISLKNIMAVNANGVFDWKLTFYPHLVTRLKQNLSKLLMMIVGAGNGSSFIFFIR